MIIYVTCCFVDVYEWKLVEMILEVELLRREANREDLMAFGAGN